MLSSNQIAGFFDHDYLWKECMDIFYFLQGNVHQGKITFETTTFIWGMSRHCEQRPNLLRLAKDPLDRLGGIASLNIIQNEKLTNAK